MATAEWMTSGLVRSSRMHEPVPLVTEAKQAGVVEFAPDCPLSRKTSPDPVPTDRFGVAGFVYDGVRAGRDVRAGLSRRSAAVRPLPMEEVCFYVKDVDNSRRRRKVDPADKSMLGRLVILGVLAVMFCLTSFGPVAGLRQSGYRLESLNRQHQSLLEVNRQLKMHSAMLSDVRRVTDLAESRGLAAPPPERYAWQDRTIMPPPDGAELASNHPTPRR
jgi:hypothetical protein